MTTDEIIVFSKQEIESMLNMSIESDDNIVLKLTHTAINTIKEAMPQYLYRSSFKEMQDITDWSNL